MQVAGVAPDERLEAGPQHGLVAHPVQRLGDPVQATLQDQRSLHLSLLRDALPLNQVPSLLLTQRHGLCLSVWLRAQNVCGASSGAPAAAVLVVEEAAWWCWAGGRRPERGDLAEIGEQHAAALVGPAIEAIKALAVVSPRAVLVWEHVVGLLVCAGHVGACRGGGARQGAAQCWLGDAAHGATVHFIT